MLKRAVLTAIVLLLVCASVAAAGGIHLMTDGFGKTTYHRYDSSQMLMHGSLFDGYGNPALYAGVQVTVQPFDGQPAAVYGGLTDAHGQYAVKVPRGSSRLITVSAAGATREVRELVAPYLWITVTPRSHGRTVFTGGVLGDPGAAPPMVRLQDRTPAGWVRFDSVNVNPHSHLWRDELRDLNAHGRFEFRAVSDPSAAYLPSVSAAKWAAVR
jgi:hypothetical protein